MDHVFYCIAIVVVSSVVIVSMMRGQWVEVSLEILFPVFLLFFCLLTIENLCLRVNKILHGSNTG